MRDKVRTWHDSSEACARDVSSGRLSLIFLRYRKVRTDRIGMYTRYRWEHVLPRRVNCSGKTGNLPSLPVILSGTFRVPGDEFQGRRRFSNNARPPLRSLQYASLHIRVRFRRRLGQAEGSSGTKRGRSRPKVREALVPRISQ